MASQTSDPYAGMNPNFSFQLHQLVSAVQSAGGNLTLASGFRDNAEQTSLYNKAVQTYGPDNAVNWAAKPGTSLHEKGLAADIHGDTKSMQLAHQLAGQFGLNFPLANENWHVQPIDLTKYGAVDMHDNKGGPTASTGGDGSNNAINRVNVLINAITGGQSGLGGTGSYSDPSPATTTGAQTDTTGTTPYYKGSSLGPTSYDQVFQQAGALYGISPTLLKAVAKQESGFNPNAKSGAGAIGLMQFMPGTAASNGVNPTDPTSSIMGAAKMLSGYIKQFGSPELALAAYNAGAGAVQKYGGIPPYQETQNYVKSIMGTVNS